MSKVHIVAATAASLEGMKGQKFSPKKGEGLLYVKFVMLLPETIESGDPLSLVENAEGVILGGQLEEIKAQVNRWFDESIKEYREKVDDTKREKW